MHHRRLLLFLLLLFPLAACRDETAADPPGADFEEIVPPTPPVTREPGELPPEITWGVARNATYPLPDGEVTLIAGQWAGTLGALGEATVFLGDYHAFGDLNGDSRDELAVFLVTRSATTTQIDLALLGLRDGRPAVVDVLPLGAGVQPWDLAIVDGRLQLLQLAADEGDPPCCPSRLTARTFALSSGALAEAGAALLPAAAPASLALFRLTFTRELPVVMVEDAFGPQSVARLLLRGSAGQRVRLALTTGRGDGVLGVVGVDGTVLQPINEGRATWTGTLPATQDYLLQLVATSPGSAYSLEIERGTGAPAGAPPPPPPMRTTPLAAGLPILADRITRDALNQPVVYLTVDNLPNDVAPALIAQLQRQNASATFFLSPAALAELGSALFAAGHSAGPLLERYFSVDATGRGALLSSLGAVSMPAEAPAACLRTPSGTLDPLSWAGVTELGYVNVGWDLDLTIEATPGSSIEPGAILRVDAAADPQATLTRLEALVTSLTQQGFRVEALCR
jgi:hypothetical protein